MTRRITDDELARRVVVTLRQRLGMLSAGDLFYATGCRRSESAILRRLRALRDEGRVVEVAGPRGSLWRLP